MGILPFDKEAREDLMLAGMLGLVLLDLVDLA
jgi:hypothetical protein